MKNNTLWIWLLIVCFLLVVALYFSTNIQAMKRGNSDIRVTNSEYEEYAEGKINGLDITTIINKAISHNENKLIEKDAEGNYVDSDDRILIYVTFNKKTYRMERLYKVGIEPFIEYFGNVEFSCVDKQYHDSGLISSMTFEAKEY